MIFLQLVQWLSLFATLESIQVQFQHDNARNRGYGFYLFLVSSWKNKNVPFWEFLKVSKKLSAAEVFHYAGSPWHMSGSGL
jgi:hypothetical protein